MKNKKALKYYKKLKKSKIFIMLNVVFVVLQSWKWIVFYALWEISKKSKNSNV